MKLFQKWRARRAAEREAVEAAKIKESESRRKALEKQKESIVSMLVDAEFVPLKKFTVDSDFFTATTWAARENKLYKISFNHKGGMDIYLVK